MLHAALENIWRELRTHAALVALAAEERAAVVTRAVAAALAEQCARPRAWKLCRAYRRWRPTGWSACLPHGSTVESLRAPFEVAASERQRPITLGGLAVEIQVDRLDRLPGGGYAIIDYKTGAVSPAQWGGRPPGRTRSFRSTPPPWPNPSSRCCSPISPPAICASGACKEGAGVPNATEYSRSKAGKAGGTLAGHIAEWRRVLENLGLQFAAGAAAVSPKTPQSCLHCDLPALCRVGGTGRGGGRCPGVPP